MAAEYNWSEEYTLNKTPYQLIHYVRAIKIRLSQDYILLAKIQRFSANAESNDFEDFLEDLEPDFDEEAVERKIDALPMRENLGDGLSASLFKVE